MIVPVLLGIALGLSLAAPPGPMNALIAREAGRHGVAAGVRVGLAAPTADVLFLAALLFGVGPLLAGAGWVRAAAAAGSLLMFAFAYNTWFPPQADGQAPARRATFLGAFSIALTNPYQIAWWLSGGFVFLQAQGLWGIAGLLCGIFAWVLVFAWLVAHGAQRWKWFGEAVRVGSAALLTAFSLLLLGVAMAIVRI